MADFVMLAKTYTNQSGTYCLSEKYDGMRALWLPSTRGMDCKHIPFAKKGNIATGLWSRLRNPINAPAWFLNMLPEHPCDGELWAGRGNFQKCMSATRKVVPLDHEWKAIQYLWFDIPNTSLIWDGLPKDEWSKPRMYQDNVPLLNIEVITTHEYTPTYDDLVSKGAEGIMLRDPKSYWSVGRTYDLLKMKPEDIMPATVVGTVGGLGKYVGMIGSLTCKTEDGIEFNVSGMTDALRSKGSFPVGTRINVVYNGLTDGGVPRFPRYVGVIS